MRGTHAGMWSTSDISLESSFGIKGTDHTPSNAFVEKGRQVRRKFIVDAQS